MGEITEEMIEAAAVGVVAELNDRSLLENIDDDVLTEINTELRARIRAALSSPREVGGAQTMREIDQLKRTIVARDRRIERLVWAMDYARAKGVVFPADVDPQVTASTSTSRTAAEAMRERAAKVADEMFAIDNFETYLEDEDMVANNAGVAIAAAIRSLEIEG